MKVILRSIFTQTFILFRLDCKPDAGERACACCVHVTEHGEFCETHTCFIFVLKLPELFCNLHPGYVTRERVAKFVKTCPCFVDSCL